jgi:hypothetical protein
MNKKIKKDVIYPCRIPIAVFERAQELAKELDISTSQLIRRALREKIAKFDHSFSPR